MNPNQTRFDTGRSTIHQVGLSCNAIPPARYGGIETVIANLSRGLVARGADVVIYAPGELGVDGARHVQTLPAPVTGPREGVMVANVAEHLDVIRTALADSYRPGDIVHLHHAEQAMVLRDLQQPLAVETAHWRNVGLRDHIIYPSRSLKAEVGRPGIVIPHGVDLAMFHWNGDEAEREDFIFYAGRVTRDKGVHLAAAACQVAGVTFKVAGPCPDADYAEQVLADAEFLGELTHDELRDMYNRARATMYLTQYNEPFGLSVVESLACGCPVITSGLGGTGEIVQHGRTGFICSSHEELVQAIAILDGIDVSDCVARAGEYSIEKMTDAVIGYYNEISHA